MNKPNIVFILIDDMGWKDIGAMGSTFYETPHIDSFAKSGMLFTDAYASCPVCSPTRASVMTGKYPARLGLTDWIEHNREANSPYGHAKGYLMDAPYIDHLPLREKSIASALKESEYQTWHVGKWHLGMEPYYPEKHGFDINIGGCMVGSPGNGGYFAPWSIPALKDVDVPEGTYLTDYLTEKTIDLIQNRDQKRPFFLNLWYYQVHTPLQGKPEKVAKYEAKRKALGLDKKEELVEGDFFPCEHKKHLRIARRVVQSHPVYAAMIESLDENIGRLIDFLKAQNLFDNTMIIFTSDNGGLATAEGSPTCNAPLSEGKGWRQEGGTREPLLISWPKEIAAGSVCSVPVISNDFYPTILEAAGHPLLPEQHVDGLSLMSLLKGGTKLNRQALYWHYPHYGNQGSTPGASIRRGDWKLIEFFEDDSSQLFNLKEDISETRDLSDQEPVLKNQMLKMLHEWQNEISAKIPVRNNAFKPWSESHEVKGFMPLD